MKKGLLRPCMNIKVYFKTIQHPAIRKTVRMCQENIKTSFIEMMNRVGIYIQEPLKMQNMIKMTKLNKANLRKM